MNERIKAIINLVITVIVGINAVLTASGKNPIPFDEATFTEVVSYVVAIGALVWSWWKNQNITEAAAEAQRYLDALKDDTEDDDDDYLNTEYDEEAIDADEVHEITVEEVEANGEVVIDE